MKHIKEFVRDTRGGLVERAAVMAGAIALACLSGAHFLDTSVRDPNSKLYALFRSNPGVDYTPTASVKKQAGQVLIDPCTGKTK